MEDRLKEQQDENLNNTSEGRGREEGSKVEEEEAVGKVNCKEDVERLAVLLEASTERGVTGLAEVLPVNSLLELLGRASSVLAGEATLVQISVQDPNAVVNVVGDTHGQYHDVLRLFSVAGWPSSSNYFIFNGDFVDRGAWGLETLTLFLAWKLVYPSFVTLIRGNHESSQCTISYGFNGELKAKYPQHHKKIYAACKHVFAALPLAATVEGNTLVMHGGLFRKSPWRPSKRRRLQRRSSRQAPLVLGSLQDLRDSSKGGMDPSGMGSTTVAGDVLWSDPSSLEGIMLNGARGMGITFGPDATEEFLVANNLKLIIRSHEGPDSRNDREDLPTLMKGFSTDHDVASGKLMTVFSAPDYPQHQDADCRCKNEGAVLVLSGPDFANPVAKCFTAAPRPDVGPFYDISMFGGSDVDVGEDDCTTSGSNWAEKDGENGIDSPLSLDGEAPPQGIDNPGGKTAESEQSMPGEVCGVGFNDKLEIGNKVNRAQGMTEESAAAQSPG